MSALFQQHITGFFAGVLFQAIHVLMLYQKAEVKGNKSGFQKDKKKVCSTFKIKKISNRISYLRWRGHVMMQINTVDNKVVNFPPQTTKVLFWKPKNNIIH